MIHTGEKVKFGPKKEIIFKNKKVTVKKVNQSAKFEILEVVEISEVTNNVQEMPVEISANSQGGNVEGENTIASEIDNEKPKENKLADVVGPSSEKKLRLSTTEPSNVVERKHVVPANMIRKHVGLPTYVIKF
jgi:hypothetical protein